MKGYTTSAGRHSKTVRPVSTDYLDGLRRALAIVGVVPARKPGPSGRATTHDDVRNAINAEIERLAVLNLQHAAEAA